MLSLVRLFLGLAALTAFLLPALAAGDPPGRVGRLSLVQGDVIVRTDRRDPGSPATINWPVSSGTIIDTERRSRAEVWIGSTAYRLAADSRAEFVTVSDEIVNLLLADGTLAVTIRDPAQADDLQIITPGGRIRFPGPGRFRVEVRPGRTTVAAQSGNAEITTGERPVGVRPGEIATLDGQGLVGIDAAPYGDDFDTWVSAQDSRARSSTARRHVSPYMTGHQDLDVYGDWATTPDYGPVWHPRAVAVDWAPYRGGRWAWIEPWGWTWVDAAPWGFAPFHYGRWVQVGGRWGWAPGTYATRPVYAPALVGWAGDPGRSVRLGYAAAPAAGWFPLAPREVYIPGYRASPTYVRQINVTHVHDHASVDLAQRPEYRPHYAYQGQSHAVTGFPHESQPVKRDNIPPDDRHALDRAPVTPRAPHGNWQAPPNGTAQFPDQSRPGHFPPQQETGRAPAPQGEHSLREPWRDAGNPDRAPRSGARQYGQPAPAMRQIQQPPPARHEHEQRREAFREPQQFREVPQLRQPQPDRQMPREMPGATPPLRQQPSALPLREAQRSERSPPPPNDHHRHSQAPDDRRSEKGQR